MLWFDGSIKNAVDKVKSSGLLFVVFVYGENNLSKKYESFLNAETKFKPQDYVAIKISNNSVAFHHFKQIYVSVPIPSVFLIKNNGRPIKVVSSDQTSDINNAISNAIESQSNNIPQESKEQKLLNGKEPSKNSKKCLEKTPSSTTKHVKNIGYKILNSEQEEVFKKKLDEIRAFPRFLHLDAFTPETPTPSTPTPVQNHSARIQFYLSNNDMPAWEFPGMATLSDVRAYLMEKLKLSPNFKLLRTYPRTTFTVQDENKTLEELSLTPSATLVVVPLQDQTVQAKMKNLITRPNMITTVLKILFQPVYMLFNFFKKHIFKTNGNVLGRRPQDEQDLDTTPSDRNVNKKTSTSNIHGFKFEDSDSDGENPDNGNSTQQRYQKK